MKKSYFLLFAFALLCLSPQAPAQILISVGTGYSQNFDGMGTTTTAALPTNWKIQATTTVRSVGAYSGASTAVSGAATTNMSTSATGTAYVLYNGTNRAVGGLSSGSGGKSVNIYAWFQNNGANPITSITLSYDVVKFRNGSNTAGFSVQMYYSTDGTTFTSAGADFLSSFGADANNSGSATVPIATASVSSKTLSGLNIANNGNLYLAWNYSVTTGTTTSSAQCLGIDNLVINNSDVLPVELSSFNAVKSGNNVKLNWATANEVNNAGFKIFRSNASEENWKSLDFVKGFGNSSSTKNYSYTDRDPMNGTNVYKLVQLDNDGTEKSIGKVYFEYKKPSVYTLEQNFPNPFNPSTKIAFYVPEAGNVKLTIYNILGLKVKELVNGYMSEGNHEVAFDAKGLASGCYIYTLSAGSYSKTMKMTLLR